MIVSLVGLISIDNGGKAKNFTASSSFAFVLLPLASKITYRAFNMKFDSHAYFKVVLWYVLCQFCSHFVEGSFIF